MVPTEPEFGLDVDRDFTLTFVQIFQLAYGTLAVIVVHPLAFYLLLSKSSSMTQSLRIGYLCNQVQLLLHDIWACFLFQAYFLLPYPIMYCRGFVCTHNLLSYSLILIIEAIFMVHSMTILLCLLLMMNQKIVPPHSVYRLPLWLQVLLVSSVYVYLCSNIVGYGLFARDVENSSEILEKADVSWLKDADGIIVVFGDIGILGTIRYEVYIIFASVAVLLPTRISLAYLSIRILRRQKLLDTSRTKQLLAKFVVVLAKQVSMVSFFYVYPVALVFILMWIDIQSLPNIVLIIIRLIIEPAYTVNSVAQFYVLISSNRHYSQNLRRLFYRLFQLETGNTSVVKISSLHSGLKSRF